MPLKVQEIPKTVYMAYILGDKDELVNGRTFRDGPPSTEELDDMLTRFNHPRREEHRKSTVVVVRTDQTLARMYQSTAERSAASAARLNGRAGCGAEEPEA